MKLAALQAVEKQLGAFVEEFAPELGRAERRYWGKRYVVGLVLDGERKSIEPMAQRVPGGNEQALQQFVNQSPWAHEPVQTKLYRRLVQRSGPGRGVLILDDTTLPKKGKQSVGVAPQYCGALGKVANCQAIVTWHYSGARMHFPVLGELYLPQSWTAAPAKLCQAGVPPTKWQFQEKWKLALELLDQFRTELAYEAIVADAGYGEIRPFLHALDHRQQLFVAQIPESHCFWPATVALEKRGKPGGRPRRFPMIADPHAQPLSAKAWASKQKPASCGGRKSPYLYSAKKQSPSLPSGSGKRPRRRGGVRDPNDGYSLSAIAMAVTSIISVMRRFKPRPNRCSAGPITGGRLNKAINNSKKS